MQNNINIDYLENLLSEIEALRKSARNSAKKCDFIYIMGRLQN